MQTKRVRERIKINGKYVVVHKETSASLVKMASGKTVEQRFKEVQDWIDAHSGGEVPFNMLTKPTKEEFPETGNETTLYATTKRGQEGFYFWDNEYSEYFFMSGNYRNISVIDGGNAGSADKHNKQ
jgi:hypothetical protein